MTREEAIRNLKDLRDRYAWNSGGDETFDMAIETLSAEAVSREEYEEVKAYMDTLVDAFIEDGEELAESVKVVRCKDCKYGQYDATHYFCAEHGHKVYEDDFCSRGERRSNRGEEVNGFKSVGQAWNTSQGRW